MSPADAWSQFDLAQFQIACWRSGATGFAALQLHLDELVERAQKNSELDDVLKATFILEGFLYYKAGHPLLEWYVNSGRIGRLIWVCQQASEWGAAAHYLSGRLTCTLAEGRPPARRLTFLKDAYQNFVKISQPVTLSRHLLLPGVRIESPQRTLRELGTGADPITNVVPVPLRYRAAIALAVAECARYTGDLSEVDEYLVLAEKDCNPGTDYEVDNKQITINLKLCAAVARLNRHLQKGRNSHARARAAFDELLASLTQSSLELPEDKHYEWMGSCWAGLACLSRVGSKRLDAIDNMLRYVKKSLLARSGKGHPFGVDPLYELAMKGNDDAKEEFNSLLQPVRETTRSAPAQSGLGEEDMAEAVSASLGQEPWIRGLRNALPLPASDRLAYHFQYQPVYTLYSFPGATIGTLQQGKLDMSQRKTSIRDVKVEAEGGQVFLGQFRDVVATLHAAGSGKNELAEALKAAKDAIMKDPSLTDEQKQEQVEVLSHVGQEASKPKPNKSLLGSLVKGLQEALGAVPGVAGAVKAVTELVSKLQSAAG